MSMHSDYDLVRAPKGVPRIPESWTPRPVVVEEILKRAFKYQVVLVRGTPACGKTILMNLIHRHIIEKHPTFRVYEFWGWPAGMSDADSKEYLERRVQMSLPELLVAQDTVVFIDDAQSSYYDNHLWSLFKILDSGAYFILFSSYGSPGPFPVEAKSGTPPIFCADQRISLHWESTSVTERPIGILLAKDEADDLITRYCINNQNRPQLSADLRDLLVTISGGHAGLKHSRFARGLPHREYLQENITAAKFLNEMSRKGVVKAFGIEQSEYRDGVLDSYHRGWIHKALVSDMGEAYVFSSPLHFWYCQALLLEIKSCIITATSPIALAIDIIKFMKPSKLSLPPEQPGTSHSAPPEDWYRKEFYRASDNILDGGMLWSPEFGDSGVKKGGSLDFYQAAKKWGLEFTREGDRLRSHYGRFQDGGNYHRWIADGELLD
ncbi:hypothetical protein K440DRAFT_663821 [Wilcoxina mikolae CBS 423.85]|nr:hypothetical protein K440DRAFT_663821 [Wilcoxina mikolae CBS 423.85]